MVGSANGGLSPPYTSDCRLFDSPQLQLQIPDPPKHNGQFSRGPIRRLLGKQKGRIQFVGRPVKLPLGREACSQVRAYLRQCQQFVAAPMNLVEQLIPRRILKVAGACRDALRR